MELNTQAVTQATTPPNVTDVPLAAAQDADIDVKEAHKRAQNGKAVVAKEKRTEPHFHFKKETLDKVIEAINEMLNKIQKDVKLKRHEKTNRIIVQIIDVKTKQVLNELPWEKIINLVLALEELLGLIVDEKR